MKKLLIFFGIFVAFFSIFSFSQISKNIDILFGLDANLPENQYNQALSFAKNGDLKNAFKALPDQLPWYEAELHELAGDILFQQKQQSGAIRAEYEKSLTFRLNTRVEYKMSLLENSENESQNNDKNSKNFPQNNHIEAVCQVLEEQWQRASFLNPYRNAGSLFQNDLKNLKNLLQEDTYKEQKDW